MAIISKLGPAIVVLAAMTSATHAQNIADVSPDLITAIETATSKQDLTDTIAIATGPVVADICTQTTWPDVEAQIIKHTGLFAGLTLHPTIDRSADGGLVQFFAWGPDFEDLIEKLNPDLGNVNLHFWLTIELMDWGTHRTVSCTYAALDHGDDARVLSRVGEAFLGHLPDTNQVASHVAPMLHQVPDQIKVRLFQSSDQRTTVVLRSAGERIDVEFNRRFDQ